MQENRTCARLLLGLLLLGLACGNPFANPRWRALIVYTNAANSELGGVNIYRDRVVGVIDEINTIYEMSEMTTRGEVAGVVRDTTYVSVGAAASLARLVSGGGGLGKYVNLLDKYSADILILRDVEPIASDTAGITWYLDVWKGKGYAALWVDGEGGPLWAHEIGHIHGANHCHGYRQTFDSLGGFVSQIASHVIPACQQSTLPPQSGFNTIMAYNVGNNCYGTMVSNVCPVPNCQWWFDPGRLGFTTYDAGIFSNPNLTWEHPFTNVIYRMGIDTLITVSNHPSCNLPSQTTVHIRRNVAAMHEEKMDTVNSFRLTPDTVVVADTMDIGFGEYAYYRANSSVRIHSGFRVSKGELKIRVGGDVGGLPKGINAQEKKGINPSDLGAPLREAELRYDAASQMLWMSLNASGYHKISVSLYDARGIRKYDREIPVNAGLASGRINISGLSNGKYFLIFKFGKNRVSRVFVKL
jgi:hypothetical protein